jgi:hypothetical protein
VAGRLGFLNHISNLIDTRTAASRIALFGVIPLPCFKEFDRLEHGFGLTTLVLSPVLSLPFCGQFAYFCMLKFSTFKPSVFRFEFNIED